MTKINYCKLLIERLTETYQKDKKLVYSIKDDLVSDSLGLDSSEVSELIYPSIMYLADIEAKSFGFPCSNIKYSFSDERNLSPFNLITTNEPTNLSIMLPFINYICDYYLAKETILANIYTNVLGKIEPNIKSSFDIKVPNLENIALKL
jgi:hypothetical protein